MNLQPISSEERGKVGWGQAAGGASSQEESPRSQLRRHQTGELASSSRLHRLKFWQRHDHELSK